MRAYDSGSEHEAKRLAHSIRVLLYDTKSSHSLLGQFRAKESLRYWSVLPDFGGAPTSLFIGVPLVMTQTNGVASARYAPNLGNPAQRLPFADWWDKEQIIVEGEDIVTRRRAVLAVANKDGGSHVDRALTELERRLLRTDIMGWRKVTITGPQPTVIREEPLGSDPTSPIVRVSHMETSMLVQEPSDLSSPLRALVRQAAHELYGTLREQISSILAGLS